MLKVISIIWSCIHALILFLFLFESRYPKKKTLIITFATMIPLVIVNSFVSFFVSTDKMGVLLLVSLSLPSLVVFWFMAKSRDGRFFFTFCFVATIVLEILYITQIINYYITPNSDIFMFTVRLIAYPLLEWFAYKKLRSIFINVQKHTNKGWYIFAAIGAIFYILMTLSVNYPVSITSRPEYLPALILIFVLIPIIYIHIIITLRDQQNTHEMIAQDNILKIQINDMTSYINELTAADERFREERHNYRHKMKTIASLVASKQYDELTHLVADYNEAYQKTQTIRYCKNAVIDAVLSTYIRNAESKGIKVNVGFAFPDPIPVSETELATVFANAIENAINACEKLDEDRRFIDIKVLNRPRFMIQIANSFDGNVEFDENDIPINHAEGHGFGTRSIVAFCKKYKAHYIFKADNEKFTLYLNF